MQSAEKRAHQQHREIRQRGTEIRLPQHQHGRNQNQTRQFQRFPEIQIVPMQVGQVAGYQ